MAILVAPLAAQNDPDMEGQFGSNQTSAEIPSPEPDDADEPWSHYLNPFAHPGVATYLSLSTGGGTRNYGETVVDGYKLTPISGLAKVAAYQSPWSTKTWAVGSYTFERRRVTLKSGASLVIFAPTANHPDPDACLGGAGVYDRDALFVPVGYQGGGFELAKNPPAWSRDDTYEYADPYTSSDTPFGYEIEQDNYDHDVPHVYWIREGSIEWEALERGMTLVYVHASLGARPLLTHLAQLIEASKWLDSCRYTGTCNSYPPSTRIAYRHRNFIYGGSYHGAVARIAANHLPWVFRGAISLAGGVDMHATFAWQEAYEFLQSQVLGRYAGGFTNVVDVRGSRPLSLFGDLEHGYAGGQSIAGVPVDVAGAGLFAWDLATPLLANTKLIVPLILVHGDQDQSQYSFFGMDLEDPMSLELGVEDFDGTDCSSNPVDHTGVVVERRAPADCHSGLIPWNAAEHAAGRGLLDLLMDEMDLQPLQPIEFSDSNTNGSIEWSVAGASGDARVASVFRDELLLPDLDGLPEEAFGDFDTMDVSDVTTGDWAELREVCEGLGTGDSIVVGDYGGDSDLELVAIWSSCASKRTGPARSLPRTSCGVGACPISQY